MQLLPEIKASFDRFFNYYQSEANRLVQSSQIDLLNSLDQQLAHLERGYFVVMFGQFEHEVDNAFNDARVKRCGDTNWLVRRGWDTPALGGRKVPFETKLSLVIDRKDVQFGKILHAYGQRNHCAHGGVSETVVIPALAQDLYIWQSLIRR